MPRLAGRRCAAEQWACRRRGRWPLHRRTMKRQGSAIVASQGEFGSRQDDARRGGTDEHYRSCTMKHLILVLLTGAALAASSPAYAAVKTIVLVHGAFADGSGWKPVAEILQSHGYSVLVVQEPETSFAADVAATRRVLDKASPCVLVGHSYG